MESRSKENIPDSGQRVGEDNTPHASQSTRDASGSEDGSVGFGQKLGVSLDPFGYEESNLNFVGLPEQDSKQSAYVTSTPIKNEDAKSSGDVLSSQVILDDPLLSSIDGDLTEHQVDNLSSDNDCDDDNFSKLYVTKIKADSNSTLKPNTSRSKKPCSNAQRRISRSQSFSGVLHVPSGEENLSCIKRNLFDIPVSPKLKNKVRERLYTLVNSMDGFEGRVNLDCDEEKRRQQGIKQQAGVTSQVLSRSQHSLFQDTSQRLDGRWCTPRNNARVNSRVCDCHYYSDLDPLCLHHQSSVHDQSSHSALNAPSVSERYGAALSNILATQMKTLHIHQEQLTQEKLSFALGKKDQELNQTISHYQDRFQHMSKQVEGLEVEVKQLQKKLSLQEVHYKDQLRQLEDRYERQLITIRSEAEKEVQEAAARNASTYKEMMDSCDQKISEIVAATNRRAAAAEEEHKTHIKQLNDTISRLQTDKSDLEAVLRSMNTNSNKRKQTTGIADGSTGRDFVTQEVETEDHRPGWETVENPDHTSVEARVSMLQNEIKAWRSEAERLKSKVDESEAIHRRLLNQVMQEADDKSKDVAEKMETQTAQETEKLSSTISVLQKKLSAALSQNVQLQGRLKESERREQDVTEQLTSLQARQIETVGCQAELEREMKVAAREAARHEAKQLMAETGDKYEELLASVRHHYRAQIEEYKMAVRVLKRELKKMSKNEAC